jgi:H+/Cl- antiporter ClcA
VLLRRAGYRRALVFCVLIGVPVSLAAFWLLAAVHELQHLVWTEWPQHLWHHGPPWWWPLPLLLVAGTGVGAVVRWLPGAGGHVAAEGLRAGGVTAAALPGVVLAALIGLPLGAVLGPEAPLMALGGGLALALRALTRAPASAAGDALLGAAGSAAAIAAVFGNPLVGAVVLMEAAGVGGSRLLALMLPALLTSGVGALVFTGFGHWTGYHIDSLSLSIAAPPVPDAGDIVWAVLLAAVLGPAVHLLMAGGRRTARFVSASVWRGTVLCALAVGVCAAAYAGATGRSPVEVASSGQATLATLGKDPHSWPVGALVAVLAFKGVAYAISLGSLRGGAIFPAVFLGAAAGALASPLPGFGMTPAIAAGMAAATATALPLALSTTVLVTLLVGHANAIPVIILAAATSTVATHLLPRRAAKPGPAEQAGTPPPEPPPRPDRPAAEGAS